MDFLTEYMHVRPPVSCRRKGSSDDSAEGCRVEDSPVLCTSIVWSDVGSEIMDPSVLISGAVMSDVMGSTAKGSVAVGSVVMGLLDVDCIPNSTVSSEVVCS